MVVIADDHLQQVIVLAGQEVTLENFRHLLDPAGKLFDRVRTMMREHHVDETQQIEPDSLSSDDGRVTVNDAALLELPQSLLQPGTRQMEAPRQRGGRCSRVA